MEDKSFTEAYGFTYSQGTLDYKVRRMTQGRVMKRGEHKGKMKIEIQINHHEYIGKDAFERRRFYIDTNIYVDPKNWNNSTQKLSAREEHSEYKSNVINNTFAAALTIIASKGLQDPDQAYIEDVDFSKLRQIFPNKITQRKTFYDLMMDYKGLRATDGDTGERTVWRIGTVCNIIKSYDTYRKRKTYIEDMNFVWSDNFNAWLVGTKKYAPSTINRTYEIVCGCMGYYWKRREEYGLLQMTDKFKDPDFKFGKKEGNKPHALSITQRDILFKHKCKKPYMEKARKMMCIQAFTSCRYGDIKKFIPANFKKEGFVKFTPTKTKRYNIEIDQPLHPHLKTLFEEVNYDTSNYYSTSNQKYDDYIVDVLQELMNKHPKAGFSDDYRSHNMRDTAISIWVKSGVNFKSVLLWAGLRKYETLEHYIDTDDVFEIQEMEKTIQIES